MHGRLSAIHRYPLKSGRGEDLDRADVESWGLAGDRRWMVVGDDGEALTARVVNRMLLLRPRLTERGLAVAAEGADDLEVDTPDEESLDVTVHGHQLVGRPAGAPAHAWLSDVLGRSARLVHLPSASVRPTNPWFSRPDDRVGFADGYPLLLTTSASLDALNAMVAAGPNAPQAPLPMRRFRPNVVVDGTPAWAEDGWRRIRIGEAVFRAVKGCDRCVMTTVDPETAQRGKEPIATLARHRRWDGKTWFGMNLIPDRVGAQIAVGDELEVLEEIPAPDGPPR